MTVIRSTVPDRLVAGDTWRFTRSFSDYPAPTWSVTYYFENADKKFSAAATADGTSHAVSIAAATTADYAPGRYRWYARATSGSIVETIEGEDGWLEVLPDPAATGTRDHRSWARRALDAIEATLEGRASNDQMAMAIAGRSISRTPIPELWQLKKDLERQVRDEEAGSKSGLGRRIRIRFG